MIVKDVLMLFIHCWHFVIFIMFFQFSYIQIFSIAVPGLPRQHIHTIVNVWIETEEQV